MTTTGLPFDNQDLLPAILDWVRIESPTTNAAAVNRMIDFIEADATAWGAEIRRITGTGGMGDLLLVASPGAQEETPGILLLSHIDTVHEIGTIERDLPCRVDGDIAFGPGIYDMKGGAYLAFAAMRAAVISGRSRPLPLRYLFVSDEEYGSPTGRAHIEREARRAKYVLVPEPMNDRRIVISRKGVARLKMRITGQPAHSGGRHQDGRSAVREMAWQIMRLEEMTDYDRGLTVNVGVARGGTRANVVPAEAALNIDVRFSDPASGAEALKQIQETSPHFPDIGIDVTGGETRPCFVRRPEVEPLLAKARQIARELSMPLGEYASGGGSDGNFTAAIAPTLDGMGAEGKGPHTHFEQIRISSLARIATLHLRLLETLS
ncbi:M20 family metallopeptidase [Mesorhizobium xinjiangense]|uniref:M20 family metallopeptidase n=1 Tax=Mesorhizobium xinjiangense TaxID=2678685 RepID=UPI0012EEB12E|nr:M20 family metallopeptidase [Mesorhizobium xinjiangense]